VRIIAIVVIVIIVLPFILNPILRWWIRRLDERERTEP
jgi:hypothetical protein